MVRRSTSLLDSSGIACEDGFDIHLPVGAFEQFIAICSDWRFRNVEAERNDISETSIDTLRYQQAFYSSGATCRSFKEERHETSRSPFPLVVLA